ncbi:hypothetical protein PK69_00535 [Xanthomonas phaseoli pv. phaseoli]|uniref:Uncharacterized protein n=1 Tax=Xanthomonas campestris pv. phaseoli TaxID=317013 RepID=A0AB34QEE5_XANCH|nr:hypothetical protein AC609_01595 [Xanthomonas phaseoli pv. phaseoli]AZU28581.1 hypothetical protein AC801_01575 [Xanthomonas sp. ISO98C4]AZU24207.1 hypothetical protein AC611_01600 [Xanthomonas phaseoli pv. phaseoli]AZU32974.1 hypothetical protein AC610_01595 [Xanthomonas phaseoli pv. phaseoli]KGT49054.1 hypothetical protein NZ02_21830 [Xanthomonas phaseoli pv. phaseoli]
MARNIAAAGNNKPVPARSGASQLKNARDARNTTNREARSPDAMPRTTPRCFLSRCTMARSAGECSRSPWRRLHALIRLRR